MQELILHFINWNLRQAKEGNKEARREAQAFMQLPIWNELWKSVHNG